MDSIEEDLANLKSEIGEIKSLLKELFPMSTKNLTFDPSAGVPYAADLALYTGTSLRTTFNVVDTSDVAFDAFRG